MSDTKKNKVGRVLIIAGSDASGGAGIQADIKTCAAFGVYSSCAITAITAQNTVGVQRVEAMSPDLVAAQMRSVLTDIGADVIKIGMLANEGVMQAVIDVIDELAPETTLVLDPVLVATSGDVLLEETAIKLLKDKLIPMAELITPNAAEAAVLTGIKIEDALGLTKAGEVLMEMGAGAALMKGGHIDGKSVIDVLVTPEGNHIMSAPRIHSRHTHGTGCTLASAVAAMLAQGASMEEAVSQAREFVFEAIRSAPKLGAGNGPLNHGLNIGDEGKDTPNPDNPFAALKDMK